MILIRTLISVRYVLAVIVLVVVAALVVIYVAGFIMLGGSRGGRKYVVDKHGNKTEVQDDMLGGGTMYGSDGSTWDDNGDGTATRRN